MFIINTSIRNWFLLHNLSQGEEMDLNLSSPQKGNLPLFPQVCSALSETSSGSSGFSLSLCSRISDAQNPDWHIYLEQRKTDGSWYSINLIVSCCKQILLIPVVHHRLWVTHIPDMPATVPYTGSQMHWWRELCINYLDGTCVRYQK